MAAWRDTRGANGRTTNSNRAHHPRPLGTAVAASKGSTSSSSRLYPLPPPYDGAVALSASVASSLSAIALASGEEDDDQVTGLLNSTLLHPSEPATPQRPHASARHLSSPLTLSHFDHSPIRHSAAHALPTSPLPFPASFDASSSSSSAAQTASLLLPALEQWRLHLLRSALHNWLQRTRSRLSLHAAFERWRHNKSSAKQQRTKTLHALQHWSHTHQRAHFHHWHNITARPERATQLYHQRLTQRLLGGWARWVRRRKLLYETAHAVVDRGEERVKREVLSWWVGQVRQRMVAEGWQVQQAGTKAIDRWRQRVAAQRRWRWQAEQADQVKAEREAALVRGATGLWHAFVSQQRQVRAKADVADRHIEKRVVRLWKQQVPAAAEQRAGPKHQRATQLHSARLQRRAITAWQQHSLLARGQREQLVERQTRRRTGAAFYTWLELWQVTRRRKCEQEQLAAETESTRSTSAFASLFAHWLRVTRSLLLGRQQLSLASDYQRSSVLLSSLSAWTSFSRRRRHHRSLAAHATVQHGQRLLGDSWTLWLSNYRLTRASERVHGMVRQQLLQSAYCAWRDAALHKRAATYQGQRRQRTLRDSVVCWHRWTHRNVQLTSAASLYRSRLLHTTIADWSQQLEERRETRALLRHVALRWRAEAVRLRGQRLLSLHFDRQRLLLLAIATLQQHAQWRRAQRDKAELAVAHYQRTIASQSHNSRFVRTAYLAWYYYTRHRRHLLQLSDTLQQSQAQVMMSSALSLWRQQAEQLRLAEEWRRRYAQAQTVSEWRYWAAQQLDDKQLANALQRLRQKKQQAQVRGAVQCWYEWCCERRVESAQLRMALVFHLRQLMAGWRRCVPVGVKQRMTAKIEAADRLREAVALKRVWRAWKAECVRGKQHRLQLATDWQHGRDSRRVRALWNEWRRRQDVVVQWDATAEQRLQARHSAGIRQLYGRWRDSFIERRAERSNHVVADQHGRSVVLRWSCRRWRALCVDSRQQQAVVDRLVMSQQAHLLKAAMATWLHLTHSSQAAAVLSAYTAQRHVQAAFLQWSELVLIERADAYLQLRQQRRLSTSLLVWRANSHVLQQQRERSERVQQLVASHRTSAAFQEWASQIAHRRHLSLQSSAVAALHNRYLLRATLSAWLQQRRIHQQMRLHTLRRVFRLWRVEKRRRNVERRQLGVAMRGWKAAAARERQVETTSRRLLVLRTQRGVMWAWQSAQLTQHAFARWRQRAADIVSHSSQLQVAAAHFHRRTQQLAVRSLLLHAQQSQHVTLLRQHLSLSHHTHLLRLALLVWVQRWREVHAVSVIAAVAAREQQVAAWQRWQEAVWDERGQRFQQKLLLTQAAATIRYWTSSHRTRLHEASLTAQCHSITGRSLLSDAFHQFTAAFHFTRHVRSLHRASAAHYTGRVSREVFAWWYNVSTIRRHMRTSRLRGLWQAWRRVTVESVEQRTAVIQAFRNWRVLAAHSRQCMQRAEAAYRQRQLSVAVTVLSAFVRANKHHLTENARADEQHFVNLLREAWLLWQQHQQLAVACRAQLALAGQYSSSAMCARALLRWKRWRQDERERMDAIVAAVQTMQESRQRRALRRWHRTSRQQRTVRSVQQLILRPVLQEWRAAATAVRAGRRQLLRQALSQWTAAQHERKQESLVQHAQQRRARRACSRIMQGWRTLSGTRDAVRQAGEELKTARRQRRMREMFDVMRATTADSSAHSRQQEDAAASFYRRHHLHRPLAAWQHLAAAQHSLHSEWGVRADRQHFITTQRRALDAWEERTSEVLRQRHAAASQSIRLTIALRSYHTSLLLHTFSVWRAAFLATLFSHSHRSASTATSDSPTPRLSSMRDLRAYIEQVRGSGRTALSALPRSPLSAATTETGSYAPSEASRPSTNGSVSDERDEQSGATTIKQVGGGTRRGSGIPTINMRDL